MLKLVPGRRAPWLAAAYALALAAGLLSLLVSGAWSAGFSGADEPAHFLNSWFVSAYVEDALGENPLAYAAEFYLHYPKISIGHWPPAYYGLVAPLFWVLPATPAAAFAINLFVSALPALGVAALLLRTHGRVAALGGALLWASLPLALEAQAFFMLDQPLAACTLAAAIAWLAYTAKQTLTRIMLFAGLAALSILIKGNGWLIVLVPAFHIALTGRWTLLRPLRLYAGAAAGAALVGPWYAATAGISADGFNHRPGIAYAAEAVAANVTALAGNVGLLGLMLAALGAGAAFRRRRQAEAAWAVAALCLSLILATMALQSIVPVDLDPRYMAPALPALCVLIVGGLVFLLRLGGAIRLAAAACAAMLALPAAAFFAAGEAKADLRLEGAAILASAEPGPGAWLIDGGSGAEGAFIAAMAVRDRDLERYTVRASKLLAESDFMGNRYRLRYSRPDEIAAELKRLGIGGIVLSHRHGIEPFPHAAQLEAAVRSPASGYRLAAALPHRGRPGMTEIWRARTPVTANIEAVRELGLPQKAALAARAD
jgi:hypothetical protein